MDTFNEAIKFVETHIELDPSLRASLLYDTVFQSIDEYVINKGYAERGRGIERKSLGKKLRLLEKDENEELKKAIAINPGLASAHMNLGMAYTKRGMLDEALVEFEHALTIDPEYPKAHYNLGLAYQKQDELDEAAAAYQQAIQLDPDMAEVHNNLGLIYDTQGKPDQAIAEYQEAIRTDPDDDTARYNLALS